MLYYPLPDRVVYHFGFSDQVAGIGPRSLALTWWSVSFPEFQADGCGEDDVFKAVLRHLRACLHAFVNRHTECVYSQQQTAKPNILAVFGDDVGYWNISAYNYGMMAAY